MLETQILEVLSGEMTANEIQSAIASKFGKDPGVLLMTLWGMRDRGSLNSRPESEEERRERVLKDGQDVRLGMRRFFYSKVK